MATNPLYWTDPVRSLHVRHSDGYRLITVAECVRDIAAHREEPEHHAIQRVRSKVGMLDDVLLVARLDARVAPVSVVDDAELINAFVTATTPESMLAFANRWGSPLQVDVPIVPPYIILPMAKLQYVRAAVADTLRFTNARIWLDRCVRRSESDATWEVATTSTRSEELIWHAIPDDLVRDVEAGLLTSEKGALETSIARAIAIWGVADLLRDHTRNTLHVPQGSRAPEVHRLADPVGKMALLLASILSGALARASNDRPRHAVCQYCGLVFKIENVRQRYCSLRHQEDANKKRRREKVKQQRR